MAASELRALIFDMDGTLADTERDGHRVAFNRAFQDFGLDWEWDVATYGELLRVSGGKERLAHYIERHRIEDSRNGLLAARGAGLATIVTVSDYTRGEDFAGARLVLSDLGEPSAPFAVLRGDAAGYTFASPEAFRAWHASARVQRGQSNT